MITYLYEDMVNLDIDWYCIINDRLVHVASNAGQLPKNFYSIEKLKEIQSIVNSLPKSSSVITNEEWINTVATEYYEQEDGTFQEKKELYCRSFIQMAQKGFYSFDRVYEFENSDKYHIVAAPVSIVNPYNEKYIDLRPLLLEYDIKDFDFSMSAKGIDLVNIINEQKSLQQSR